MSLNPLRGDLKKWYCKGGGRGGSQWRVHNQTSSPFGQVPLGECGGVSIESRTSVFLHLNEWLGVLKSVKSLQALEAFPRRKEFPGTSGLLCVQVKRPLAARGSFRQRDAGAGSWRCVKIGIRAA